MRFKLILLSLLCSSGAIAQNMISMTTVHPVADTTSAGKQELALRYPALRQFQVVATAYDYGHFDAQLNDQDLTSGQIKTFRTTSFFNTPAARWRANTLSATLFYTYTALELKDNVNALPEPQVAPITSHSSTIDLALNYSRAGHIFHHPIIYSLIANFISDDLSSVRRFNFNASFSLPLIRKASTSLSVGALLLVDPSAPVPVLPIVNYYHRFTSSGIELIIDLPTGINLKKQVIPNAWVLIGSNQNSYSTFYNSHDGLLDGKSSYNTVEARSGLAFEYLFAKKIILGIGAGVNNTFTARVFKSGENYSSASVISTNKSTPYAALSISLLPF